MDELFAEALQIGEVLRADTSEFEARGGWLEMQEHACWVQSDDDIVDHIPRNYEVLKEPDRQYDVREEDKCCTSPSTMDDRCWIR